MPSTFEHDTSVTRVSKERFVGTVYERWQVGRGPNGGYIAAVIMRALQGEMEQVAPGNWLPRSFTIHFLRPPMPGPCEITVTIERVGRTLTTLAARLTQRDTPYALALAAFAMPRASAPLVDNTPPVCPPPEECVPFAPEDHLAVFARQYEYRWGIGDPPFSGSAHARVGGWLRPREPTAAGAPLVAALTDAWMPCVFPRLSAPIAAPTVDLTIHFRTAPPPLAPDAWYLAVYSSQLGVEGFFEEDGEVWSHEGVLLAQSRQLALLPES